MEVTTEARAAEEELIVTVVDSEVTTEEELTVLVVDSEMTTKEELRAIG